MFTCTRSADSRGLGSCRHELDYDLIELEGIRLLRAIGRHGSVTVQNLADERLPLALRQAASPCNERGSAERGERLVSLEVPGLVFHMDAIDLEAALLGQCAVFFRREMHEG